MKFQPKICFIRKPRFVGQANLDIITSWLKNWTYLNQTTQIYDKTHKLNYFHFLNIKQKLNSLDSEQTWVLFHPADTLTTQPKNTTYFIFTLYLLYPLPHFDTVLPYFSIDNAHPKLMYTAVYCACSFFMNLDLFCIDNARVTYRKIRYLLH